MERWLVLMILIFSLRAFASPSVFIYEGYLTDNVGTPLTGAKDFKFDIYGDACRLGQFAKSGVSVTGGHFSVAVGDSGSWTPFGSATDLVSAMTASPLTGSASCAFSETAASRRYVQVTVCDAGFVSCETQGSLETTPSPNALKSAKSDDAASLGGLAAANYLTQADVQAFAKTSLPTCAGGEVLKANGTNLSCVTDVGMSSLNGLAVSGQTLASGFAGTSPGWSSVGSTHTLNIPMASTTAVTAGLLSKTDYDAFTAKLNKSGGTMTGVLTLAGAPSGANDAATKAYVDAAVGGGSAGGDLSGTYPNPSVVKIRGTAVSATAPSAAGQVLRYDGGTSYTANFLSLADIRSTVTPANTMFPAAPCTTSQTLTWSSLTDTMTCTGIGGLSASAISSGTLSAARLGSGTADATTYLRGDGTWNAVAGADNLGNHTASANIVLGSNWLSGDGGNEGLSVDAAGNVGVGQAAPASRLDVNATNSGDPVLRLTGASGQSANMLTVNNSVGGTIFSVNNLGAVSSNASVTGSVVKATAGTTQASPAFVNSSDVSTGAFFPGGSAYGISTGGTERMRIDSSGKVGIGTGSPSGTLHISDGNPVSGILLPSGPRFLSTREGTVNNDFYLVSAGSSGAGPSGNIGLTRARGTASIPSAVGNSDILGAFVFNGYDGSNVLYNTAGIRAVVNGAVSAGSVPTDLILMASSANLGQERMRITSAGNVGIGTVSPGSKLTVNGTVEATDLKVTGGGTPPPGRVLISDPSGNAVWGVTDLARALQIQAQGNSNILAVVGSSGSVLTGGTALTSDSTGPTAGVRYYSASTGTIVGAAGPVFTYPAWSPLMDAMITTDSPLSNQMIWIGLSDSSGVGPCSTESNCVDSPTGSKVLAFRYSTSAGDAAWQCVACGGSACTVVTSGVSVSTLTNYRLRIEHDAAGAAAKFWINGMSVCGSVTTNLPTGSSYLAPHATLKVLVGSTRALIVNRMSVRTN